jgi:hypothetical protein
MFQLKSLIEVVKSFRPRALARFLVDATATLDYAWFSVVVFYSLLSELERK